CVSLEGHTLQRMYGCESDDGGIIRRYDQYGFDGEDFISLDLETGTWTAVKPQDEILKSNWESNGYTTRWKNFLEHDCIDLLNTFVNYGRVTVERKVRPETSLFRKEASPPEVVCDATGFCPKALNISWQKDGEDVHEDVKLRETLPNQDGSFQKKSILKVSAEELQKHTYTCVIEHCSLEKDLVLPVSE
ncbi:major histocompatibility complex class I UBA precursor, partial [Silurus asotus]